MRYGVGKPWKAKHYKRKARRKVKRTVHYHRPRVRGFIR